MGSRHCSAHSMGVHEMGERGAANPRTSHTHSLGLVGSAALLLHRPASQVAALAEGWEVGRRGRESAGPGFTN